MDNSSTTDQSPNTGMLTEAQFPGSIIRPRMLAADTTMKAGDMYQVNAQGVFQRLPPGTAGQVLTITAGIPTWTTPAASGMAYSDLRFKTGQFTHDISTTGTQAITGVGFTPKVVGFISVISSVAHAFSVGFDDGTTHHGTFDDNSRTAGQWSLTDSPGVYSILLAPNADATTTSCAAYVSAFGADGFTLTWSKVGSPTGTAGIGYLAYR